MIYLVTNQILPESDSYQRVTPRESLDILEPLTIVGLDTETEGLDVYTKKLLLLQLGCYDFQVVIDCTTIDINIYKEYLESDRTFLGWNLKFDLKFLFHNRIVPINLYDGFLAEKLMWLGYPAGTHPMSLKHAADEYLGIDLDKTIRGQIIWKGLCDDVIVYAADDVKYLERIMNLQHDKLSEKDLLTAIVYENKFVLPLAYCEYCGMKLDIDKWKEKMKTDNLRKQKALESCNNWILKNCPEFTKKNMQGDLFTGFNTEPVVSINLNSAKQLIPLFKKYNVDITVEAGSKDSIDAKVLKPQEKKCSFIPIYLDYKEAVKVTSTYGENFIEQINPVSGRIHTNYNQLGAGTTRISSGGNDKENKIKYLNFLNLPKEKETRGCFIAESGNKWISMDYNGQESCLMASIANDKAMLDEIMYGDKDLHTLTAKLVFKEIPKNATAAEVKSKFHDQRDQAKGYEFAFNYAGNDTTIMRNFGLTAERAKEIYDSYMEGFNGLKAYQEFRKKEWIRLGYILLNPLTGHKNYIYDYDKLLAVSSKFKEPGFWEYYREMKVSNPECDTVKEVREYFKKKSTYDRYSVNYPIQATGSMCLRVALVNFFKYLRKNNLLFKVLICVTPYDEINCEAPEAISEQVVEKLHECMANAGDYFCTRCKLDADVSRLDDGSLPTCWVH